MTKNEKIGGNKKIELIIEHIQYRRQNTRSKKVDAELKHLMWTIVSGELWK